LLFTALGTTPAVAHEDHSQELPVVDAIEPDVPGVEVRAVPGGFGKLALTTRGRTTATVLGRSGQPILRTGPGGVEANRAAPEWYRDNEPLGIADVPRMATAGAPPRWERVSTERTWEWFDHRLHPADATVRRWAIPLRVDDTRATVRGHTQPGRTFAAEIRAGAPGVALTTIPGPVLSLQLRAGDRTIGVLGADGEVFARVGPRRTTVNVRSPLWVPTAQYGNRSLLGAVIDPGASPRMRLVSSATGLIWPDPRLAPRGREPERWTIPLRVGGRRTSVTGTTRFAPPPEHRSQAPPRPASPPEQEGGIDTIWVAGSVAAGLALIGGAALVGRGRRRTPRR
jgi:hypothetical protein